jgi:hypothetical protein
MRESLRQDRPVGLTSPALHLAAAPAFFVHAVVTEAKSRTSATPSMAHPVPERTNHRQ